MTDETPSRLVRVLGIPGATVVGLSAMVGTGLFAVWTPALETAGRWLVLAVLAAAGVAALNAVSSARLAVRYPESGGAYAYGRRCLNRWAGVAAGWFFIIGKSASAAAAGLTIGAYVWPDGQRWIAWLAIAIALAIDLRGIAASTTVSAFLVGVALAVIVIVLLANVGTPIAGPSTIDPTVDFAGFLVGVGLVFVAFAGYARVTVLGEEVRSPRRTIPRAMVLSFAVVLIVYVSVAIAIVAKAGAGVTFGEAPILDLAQLAANPALVSLTRIAAVLAAGAVLVSLLAGVGRTVFAMASQGDAPRGLQVLGRRIPIPYRAEVLASVLAAFVVTAGRIGWALALSAVTIMGYYSVTHLSALTLPTRWGRVVAVLGLASCLVVAGGLLLALLTDHLPSL